MFCGLYLLLAGGLLGSGNQEENTVLPKDGTEWAVVVLGPSWALPSLPGAWLLLEVHRTGFIMEQIWDRQFRQRHPEQQALLTNTHLVFSGRRARPVPDLSCLLSLF